jgi:hypothetical protein
LRGGDEPLASFLVDAEAKAELVRGLVHLPLRRDGLPSGMVERDAVGSPDNDGGAMIGDDAAIVGEGLDLRLVAGHSVVGHFVLSLVRCWCHWYIGLSVGCQRGLENYF